MMIEHLITDHLQPWAREHWEKVYAARPRLRASREDLLYGFMGGILTTHSAEAVLTEQGVATLKAEPISAT